MDIPALYALALGLNLLLPGATALKSYEKAIQQARQQETRSVNSPTGWTSLVALATLTGGDVSVGSAPGTTVPLQHGPAHAFTLHIAGEKITLTAVDTAVTIDGKHPHIGDAVTVSNDGKATLHWGGLWASVIRRTGNQTYLRVGDAASPNRRGFHGLRFYPVDPAYRITAKWVPYTTPHEVRMGTVLGTILVEQSPGYAEFVLDGQTVRIDALPGENETLDFAFRDGTSTTTTYGAGRELGADRPSNGIKAPGVVVLDFNLASNWPCAYTEYGTCPLPPKQNRFKALIPAGEKRYHDEPALSSRRASPGDR